MIKTKLNIPATLVHSVKGKLYKVNGILLSVNESNDTCSMKFKGQIEKNIPLSKVLINEGFIDKIKEYGKNIANYITLKVKGFIVLVDEVTHTVLEWSQYNVANLAVKAAQGKLPKGVLFAGSDSLLNTAGVRTLSYDEAFAPSMANDRKNIIKYWQRVMNRTVQESLESIEDSIKYVNEHYYTPTKQYKQLNEVVYDTGNIKTKSGQGQYGTTVKSVRLKALLKENIENQISGPLGGHADEVPILIWGAPGIGKTAIIKQVIKEMANRRKRSIRLNLETIMLGGYTIENWTLPLNSERTIQGVNLKRFRDNPKAWLPVYLNTEDPEERKKRDDFCNRCVFLSTNPDGTITNKDGLPYEGGVVFMDEYSRVDPKVQKIIMGITNEHTFGDDYAVASKWGFVFAANRAIDDNEADSDDVRYYPVPAQINRFQHVTYVPTKDEWIDWARQKDKVTGEANVPPFIVDFIAASPDHVWYSTVVNGGYDDMLLNPEIDKQAHLNDEEDLGDIQDVLDQPLLKTTKRMITPRTWANVIGPAYKKELIKLFNDSNDEGMSGEDYYMKLIKDSVIEKTDEDGNTYKDYYGGILPDVLVDALNNIDEEDWEEWVEDKGGRDTLDPGHEFRGIKGRYNMFMQWFMETIRYKINDSSGENAATSTAPVLKAWTAYNSYTKIFTPDVILYIWEYGCMPREYQKDDDKKPLMVSDFADTEFSKWKASSTTCMDVCNMVWKGYPGNLESDIAEDLENIHNAASMSDSEVIEKAKELNKEYSFKLNSETKTLLFDNNDFKNVESLRYKVRSLMYSKVTLNLTHFAMWIAKIKIQSEFGSIVSLYKDLIIKLFNNINDEVSSEFLNKEGLKAAISAKRKDPKNKALILALNMENAKSCIFNPMAILERAANYDWDQMRAK